MKFQVEETIMEEEIPVEIQVEIQMEKRILINTLILHLAEIQPIILVFLEEMTQKMVNLRQMHLRT